jgi:hypothetical protein
MTSKVIYISFVRLTDKTSRDWYVDYLIGKGITVEYWDVVALVRNGYDEAAAKTTDYLHSIRTYGELEERLRLPENKNAYFAMLVSYAGFTVRLFRLLSKYDCHMLYIAWGALPVRRMNRWRRLWFGFSNPLRLALHFYYREKAIVYRKLKLIKPFDIVFAAGQVMMTGSQFATKVVPINSADYDQYQKAKLENVMPIVEGSYAVFLDVYLPYHADAKVLGWSTVRPDEYYASLNRFFDLLEAKYKIKVVISAHPRADYRISNPFNGRKIFHGRTPDLVKDADFVLSHSSMSQSYAIFNFKPIVFIYTNEMLSVYKRTAYMDEIYDAAEYLDAAIYNIDEISKDEQIVVKDANLARYEDFKYSFLVSRDSENATTQEIFWREICATQ